MAKRVKQKNDSASRLTVPDLVLLSLLAERPMHGYEINTTLEERNIRDWAPVSRPQIYYSLEKLLLLGMIEPVKDDSSPAGPEKRVVRTTATGVDRLAKALEAGHWVDDRVYQPFLIWMALSWQARGKTFVDQLNKRKDHLTIRLAGKRATLEDVMEEVGHPHHEAVWMLDLVIAQLELEISWLNSVIANAERRAPAKNVPLR